MTNVRGGDLRVGGGGHSADFTPVVLLTSRRWRRAVPTDVDFITSRIAEPLRFDVTAREKLRDGAENHLGDIEVTFPVRFPEGDDGDRRARAPAARHRPEP